MQTRPIDDTYQEVVKLIYSAVWDFIRAYGGDFDEALSEANDAFMSAYAGYNPQRGEFSTLIMTSIHNRLIDGKRRQHRDNKKCRISISAEAPGGGKIEDSIESRPHEEFSKEDFFNDLSEDAKIVLDMILDPPPYIANAVQAKGDQPRNWRSTIRQHLQYKLYWDSNRVQLCFAEIKTKLEQ